MSKLMFPTRSPLPMYGSHQCTAAVRTVSVLTALVGIPAGNAADNARKNDATGGTAWGPPV